MHISYLIAKEDNKNNKRGEELKARKRRRWTREKNEIVQTLSINCKSHEMKAPEAQVETPLISNDNSMIEMMVSHSSG